MSAHSIAATLTNSFDNIVISGTLGLTAIGFYGNYSYISSSILSFLLIAFRALTPAIGNSLFKEDEKKNLNLFNGLFFLSFWLTAFCSAAIIGFMVLALSTSLYAFKPFGAIMMFINLRTLKQNWDLDDNVKEDYSFRSFV